MADLSRPATDGRRDRAQLMLVTALALAVVLVVLVLLVNTAIYTENLATRGVDVGADDALEHRAAVVDGVGGVVVAHVPSLVAVAVSTFRCSGEISTRSPTSMSWSSVYS